VFTVYGARGSSSVPLVAGWNLVGPTETVDEPNAGGRDPFDKIGNAIYGYSEEAGATYFDVNEGVGRRPLPSWHVQGKLVRGYGYWMQVAEDTTIQAE